MENQMTDITEVLVKVRPQVDRNEIPKDVINLENAGMMYLNHPDFINTARAIMKFARQNGRRVDIIDSVGMNYMTPRLALVGYCSQQYQIPPVKHIIEEYLERPSINNDENYKRFVRLLGKVTGKPQEVEMVSNQLWEYWRRGRANQTKEDLMREKRLKAMNELLLKDGKEYVIGNRGVLVDFTNGDTSMGVRFRGEQGVTVLAVGHRRVALMTQRGELPIATIGIRKKEVTPKDMMDEVNKRVRKNPKLLPKEAVEFLQGYYGIVYDLRKRLDIRNMGIYPKRQ